MKYQVVNPAAGQLEREFPTAKSTRCWLGPNPATRCGGTRPRPSARTCCAGSPSFYRDRSSDLGAIITREMGKTTAEARGELEFTAAIYRYYAEQGPELLKDEPLPPGRRGGMGPEVPDRGAAGQVTTVRS